MDRAEVKDAVLNQAYQAAEAAQFVMSLKDVGIVALAMLLLVVLGAVVIKRFVLDGKRAEAEGGFLGHMTGRLEKMEALVEQLAAENKALIMDNANLSARIQLLEQHEAEVTKLRRILDQKDDKISDLEIALENLTNDKEQMEMRVRSLEKQISECNCGKFNKDCE